VISGERGSASISVKQGNPIIYKFSGKGKKRKMGFGLFSR
jgi:hypothetical protein